MLSLALGMLVALASPARAAQEPDIHLTPDWVLLQALPSPRWHIGAGVGSFGFRWQVTPLLYSWGMNRKLSPWRYFIVEPLTRHSGSIELHVSPEYAPFDPDGRWTALWQAGARAYFPVVAKGDYLSVSAGVARWSLAGRAGIACEAGAYALFGILGIQLGYAPELEVARWTFTLRIRWF